jgi:hypothetical protein
MFHKYCRQRLAIRRCRNRSANKCREAECLAQPARLSHVTKLDLKDNTFRLH